MAVEEIKKAISQKVENQVQQIRRRAELVAKREKELAERRLQDWLEEAERKFLREKLELISLNRASLNKELRLLEGRVRSEIWQVFWTQFVQELSKVRNVEGYENWLENLWNNISEGQKFSLNRLRCNPYDVEKIRKFCKNKEIISDESIKAGFILEDETAKMRLDLTVVAIVENRIQYLKKRFWQLFDELRRKNDV